MGAAALVPLAAFLAALALGAGALPALAVAAVFFLLLAMMTLLTPAQRFRSAAYRNSLDTPEARS
jgi:ABC-type transport system involved in cytochrome c biogenesis permease subunit